MDRKEFRRIAVLCIIIPVMCFWLGGCNSISGVGRDMQGGSYGVAKYMVMYAERSEPELRNSSTQEDDMEEAPVDTFKKQRAYDEKPVGWTRQRWEYYKAHRRN